MPTRAIYLSESDVAVWDAATEVAQRYRTSLSSMIISDLKRTVRERQGMTGVPLGVAVPASMKDPAVLRREQAVERIKMVIEQELIELTEAAS